MDPANSTPGPGGCLGKVRSVDDEDVDKNRKKGNRGRKFATEVYIIKLSGRPG